MADLRYIKVVQMAGLMSKENRHKILLHSRDIKSCRQISKNTYLHDIPVIPAKFQ